MKTNPLKRIPLTKEELDIYMDQLASIRNEIKAAADKIRTNEEQEKKIWNMQMEINRLNNIIYNLNERNRQLEHKMNTSIDNGRAEDRRLNQYIQTLNTRIEYLQSQISQK